MRTLFVVGVGRVGTSIARAVPDGALLGAWDHASGRVSRAEGILGVPVGTHLDVPELHQAEVVLLSVVDDKIEAMAGELAPHLQPSQVLLHTSGSQPASVMAVAGMRAHLGCAHPLQAFADPDGDPHKLRGITFAVEGDPSALAAARELADLCGATTVEIRPEAKTYYHAAAVISANFLTVLVDVAALLAAEAGVSDTATAVRMLLPLLDGTLDNLRSHGTEGGRQGLARSLTGPARRGDLGTIREHLRALDGLAARGSDTADIAELYRLLGARAVELATFAELDPERAETIIALFKDKTER